MRYPPEDGYLSKYSPGPMLTDFLIRQTSLLANHYTKPPACYYVSELIKQKLFKWRLCLCVCLRVSQIVTAGIRPQSRSLESQTAALQSLWLASRLKPWLRTIDGLRWLMAASHCLRVQTRKRTAANKHSRINLSHYYVKSNTKNSNDAVCC